MSTVTEVGRPYWRPTHTRNDSEELDVFEAAQYFSGAPVADDFRGPALAQMPLEEMRPRWEGGRKSLDMPLSDPIPPQSCKSEKFMKEKRSKQPSSPGGKLASFLNSLFSQASHKKKSKSSSSQSVKEDDESPSGRRKRRSSISHFTGIGTSHPRSLYSSSSSSIRTPPTVSGHSDQRQVVPLSKLNGYVKPASNEQKEKKLSYVASSKDRIWGKECMDKERKSYVGKINSMHRDRRVVGELQSQKSFAWAGEVDDGAESDSSSDLFDLPNYDLGIYSNGLPVYETTHVGCIKREVTSVLIASSHA